MKTAQSVLSIEGLKVAENRRNSTHPCAAPIPITFISVNCLGRASKCFSKNYRHFFFFWPIPAAFKWVPVPFPHPICSFSVAQAVPHLVPTLSTLCHCFNEKGYPGFFSLSEVIEKFLNEASTLTEIDFTTLRLGAEKE